MKLLRPFLAAPLALLFSGLAFAAEEERTVDPTFLHRFVPDVAAKTVAISSPTAKYQPLFGDGDAASKTLQGVTRFGELEVAAGGKSALVKYPREEHMLVILKGSGAVSYGGKTYPVKAEDYVYLPANVEFGLSAAARSSVTAVLMGFRIPEAMPIATPASITMANIADVPLVAVDGHPLSSQFRLMMGDTTSTRDKISTGHLMISLFVMEFKPNGTNFPHHHPLQEEIYLVIDGDGEIVAGGGANGIEQRFPAKVGDAYYYRPNTTVGFYSSSKTDKPARILAVRNNLPPSR
jgi:mannose-6-phosphate isomerase-like protein (cupin superfamily)